MINCNDKDGKNRLEGRRWSADPGSLLMAVYIGLLACIVILSSLHDAAGAEMEQPVLADGLTFFSGENRLPGPILSQDVSIQISGMLARTTVRQHFINPSREWVEAVYVFPLPEESSVDHLQLRVGERLIEGRIMERQQARKIHEKAKREGRRSGLLVQQRPNIFTTRVANIGPGEKVTVELEYQQRIMRDDIRFSLRFPMVVGPRYIPGTSVSQETGLFNGNLAEVKEGWASNTDLVPDASRITPPVALGGERPECSITVDLAPGFPLKNLLSRYHEVLREKLTETHYRVVFRGPVAADRDFVLEWQPEQGEMVETSLFSERFDGGQYMLLMLMPPTTDAIVRMPRELIFVLDVSGSMAGQSILQAKAAIDLALGRLRGDDLFELIVFNQQATALFGHSVAASPEAIAAARAFLQRVKAEGGTEMAESFKLALDGRHHHDRLRQVVFLTDGAVGNESQLFSVINRRLGDSRLFPVGIGSAPNSHFMRRAATVGRGSFSYIGSTAEVKEKMERLFHRLESPVLTDLQLELGENTQKVEFYPNPLPDLYHGEPLMVALKIGWQSEDITISGRQGGRRWQRRVETTAFAERPGIAGLWGREKIATLMQRLALGGEKEQIQPQVLQTALAHHLVSKYTSLIAVDNQVVRPPADEIRTAPVATALPQGWQAAAVFAGAPQTATPAALYRLAGTVLLLLTTLFLWMNRCRRRTLSRY